VLLGELEKAAEEMEGPWLKWHRSLKRDREGGRDEVTCPSFLIKPYPMKPFFSIFTPLRNFIQVIIITSSLSSSLLLLLLLL
jgi:hypothetical protein